MPMIDAPCDGCPQVRLQNHMQRARVRRKWWQTSSQQIMGGCEEKTGASVFGVVQQFRLADVHLREDNAQVLFRVGKQRDGYFTNKGILQKANHAMDILDKDYPDDEHVFFYDNAKTHTARRPDALSARNMPVKPPKSSATNFLCAIKTPDGITHKILMQDGRFLDGMPQSFYFPEGHPQAGLFKGMRCIIQEHISAGADLPDPTKLLAQCRKFKCLPGATKCCGC